MTVVMTKNKSGQSKKRVRTYGRHRSVRSRSSAEASGESDSRYFLKLILFALLATVWLRFKDPIVIAGLTWTAIPLGVLLAILAVKWLEHRQSDRKIWYAVVVIIGIVTNFIPVAGFYM